MWDLMISFDGGSWAASRASLNIAPWLAFAAAGIKRTRGTPVEMLCFPDVDVYEARSDYWSGQILAGIGGGESLYLKDRADRPWGLEIGCDDQGEPHSVRFANGAVWSFFEIKERLLKTEWPLFLEDYRAFVSCAVGAPGRGKMIVRVERLFSDSFHVDLVSDNACLHDLLVWHYPPRVAPPSEEY